MRWFNKKQKNVYIDPKEGAITLKSITMAFISLLTSDDYIEHRKDLIKMGYTKLMLLLNKFRLVLKINNFIGGLYNG